MTMSHLKALVQDSDCRWIGLRIRENAMMVAGTGLMSTRWETAILLLSLFLSCQAGAQETSGERQGYSVFGRGISLIDFA